jgi:regulatory helix-turn-helix LysR family protein
MDVDTRLLCYFATVAEEGNLTRAAQLLYVSQPALTKQIKQVEGLLGVALFRRSREGMTLTEPGLLTPLDLAPPVVRPPTRLDKRGLSKPPPVPVERNTLTHRQRITSTTHTLKLASSGRDCAESLRRSEQLGSSVAGQRVTA